MVYATLVAVWATVVATFGIQASAAAPSATGGYQPVPETRILDTGVGLGAARAAVPAHGSLTLQIAGRGGIPANGVSAVALTLSVQQSTSRGYIQAYPIGSARPATFNLVYGPRQRVANLSLVALGTGGRVSIYNDSSGTVRLLGDVSGFYAAGSSPSGGSFQPLPGVRLLDTATGVGVPRGLIPAHRSVSVAIAGRGGVPSNGVGAFVLNLGVLDPAAAGSLTFIPNSPVPMIFTFAAHQSASDLAVIDNFNSIGEITVYNNSARPIRVTADLFGYFRSESLGDSGYLPFGPSRLADTSRGLVLPRRLIPAHGTVTVQVTNSGSWLTGGAAALNLSVLTPTTGGTLTAYPSGSARPSVASVAFDAHATRSALTLVTVGLGGRISLYNDSAGPIGLAVDVFGFSSALVNPLTRAGADTTQLGRALLSWSGDVTDVSQIMVRRAVGSVAPASPNAGTFVADVTWSTSYLTDAGLAPGQTYSYALFAHVGTLIYTPPVKVTVRMRTASTITWTTPTAVDSPQGSPGSLSCPTSSWCMSRDRGGLTLVYSNGTWSSPPNSRLADTNPVLSCASPAFCLTGTSLAIWDGTSWIANPNADGGRFINSISCPTAQFCAAVDANGYALTYTAGSWSSPIRVEQYSLAGVSCAGAASCVAIDSDGDTYVYSSGTWTAAARSPGHLVSISCPAANDCVAVGYYFSTSGPRGAASFTFTDGAWSGPHLVPGATSSSVQSLTCPTTSFCQATLSGLQVATYSNGSWSSPVPVDPAYPLPPQFRGGSVSCYSPTSCVYISPVADAATFDGTGWTTTADVEAQVGIVQAVDCLAPTFCLAVDQAGNAVTYDGTNWSAPQRVERWADLQGVACVSTTFCVAVGDRITTTTPTPRRVAAAWIYDGTTWSAASGLSTVSSTQLVSVACTSSTACTAVGNNPNGSTGLIAYYNGTWSAPAALPSHGITSVSCPSATCLALDDQGNALTLNGTTITKTQPARIPATWKSTISCTGPTFCLASNGANTATFNGSTWTPGPDAGGDLSTALSCVSSRFCVEADSGVFAYNGSSWSAWNPATEPALSAVSCPATTWCMGLSPNGASIGTQ